jgi:pyridoxamine 5'-phosphate oxidase
VSALHEEDVDPDPLAQFSAWFADARAAQGDAPGLVESMTVATATPDGAPSARMVLLKGVDERGFVFFTNYESRKGGELHRNPRAALLFHWPALGRQVRVEGAVERCGDDESSAYFATRPPGSRLGAWASPQSRVIPRREELDRSLEEVRGRLGDALERPPFWGGYRVRPEAIEFWQHRDDRLHDRLRYRRDSGGGWLLERLAP